MRAILNHLRLVYEAPFNYITGTECPFKLNERPDVLSVNAQFTQIQEKSLVLSTERR